MVGATQNNLKGVDVKIPLGCFVAVTGVSGSGKSSLVNEVIYKTLAGELNGARMKPGACQEIRGLEFLDKVIDIDQSPIGRTPRSNPATYTGVFTDIRNVFAQTNDAKMRGYGPGRFSFNVKGGGVKPVRGTASSKLRCTSCRIFLSPARSARAAGTTGRPWRSSTRAKASTTCWR